MEELDLSDMRNAEEITNLDEISFEEFKKKLLKLNPRLARQCLSRELERRLHKDKSPVKSKEVLKRRAKNKQASKQRRKK